jgi:hypothetical protein
VVNGFHIECRLFLPYIHIGQWLSQAGGMFHTLSAYS